MIFRQTILKFLRLTDTLASKAQAHYVRLKNAILYINCANSKCSYKVRTVRGHICVCDRDCYDLLRDVPGIKDKLLIS